LGAVLGAELRSGQGWPQATAGGGAAAACVSDMSDSLGVKVPRAT
jgi:hypothetical protein